MCIIPHIPVSPSSHYWPLALNNSIFCAFIIINFFYFSWGKQRAISPTSGRPNFTKFARKACFRVRMNPFAKHFWKFASKGSFSKKVNFCVNIVNDFRLQAAMSAKWIQIAGSHDRLARLRNVGFPFVTLESIQSLACRARTRSELSNVRSRVIYILKLAATLRGSRPGVQSALLIMTSLMSSQLGNYKR